MLLSEVRSILKPGRALYFVSTEIRVYFNDKILLLSKVPKHVEIIFIGLGNFGNVCRNGCFLLIFYWLQITFIRYSFFYFSFLIDDVK